MDDQNELEFFYKEDLEEQIIRSLAEEMKLSMEDAMKRYYHSQTAVKIGEGRYGIQYLDHKNLARLVMAEA